ncbi:MAG: phage baseplate assembly protein V [Acidimicrobiales bacterium]
MSMTAGVLDSPTIKVDGVDLAEGWAAALTSLSLEMQLQLPSRLTLRFVMPVLAQSDSPPALPFAIGKGVSVSLPRLADQGAQGVTFSDPAGALVVTECGVDYDGGQVSELVVVAHDMSYHLTRQQRIGTYTNMTASDIVRQIASEAGLSATVDSTQEVLDYTFQADTDFGFITTLARRYGYDWWVKGRALSFVEASTRPHEVTVTLGEQLIRFSVSQSAVPHRSVTVTGWDRDQKTAISSSASSPETVATEVPGSTSAATGLAQGSTYQASGMGPTSTGEAQTIATALAAGVVGATTEAEGEVFGDPTMVPGTVVKVIGDYIGGSYVATRVDHRFTGAGYVTRFTAGDRAPHGLADVLGGGGGGPSTLGAFNTLPTMLSAVVTDIGKGDDLGRVKVKFPHLSDADTSHWARVLSAGGGPERGFWFLPEIDDEVLVGFEGGDPRFPVVMGGLYGKVNTPEAQLVQDGKINSRSLRSRLGHYMDFVDGTKAAERSITLGLGKDGKAGTDYRMRIGEDRFDIEVPKGKPIAIKSGSSQITFTDSDSIEISASKITVKADQELTLEGGQKLQLKAGTEVAITQGGSKVTLNAGGFEAKGTPMATVKGSPMVKIG